MVFSSPEFLFVFLPLVWLVWLLALRLSALSTRLVRRRFTVFLRCVGYYTLPLLLASIGINYWLAGYVTRPGRHWLWLGVAFNLGLLGWFKYSVFLLSVAKLPPRSFSPLVLPLGISSFTFQQIAFLVDVRRGTVQRGPLSLYSVFVSFFPQLVAGPIVHYRDLAPQLNRLARPSAANMRCGLLLLALGLAKKLMIADNLAPYVNQLYGLPADAMVTGNTALPAGRTACSCILIFPVTLTWPLAWRCCLVLHCLKTLPRPTRRGISGVLAPLAYHAFQLPPRLFVYSLGGSQHGLPRHLIALLATMLLGGLWRGTGWHCLLWGGLHGGLLAVAVIWPLIECFSAA